MLRLRPRFSTQTSIVMEAFVSISSKINGAQLLPSLRVLLVKFRIHRFSFQSSKMGLCLAKPKTDGDDSEHRVEFAGRNVHLITTKESWEQKLAEAKRDGTIEFITSWDIKATPTFFFLKDGQQIDKLVGANKLELQKKIIAMLNSAVSCEK